YHELATQQEQLAAGLGLEAVRTWSARSRATMLVDPASLGAMRWLLLATDDLSAPPWLNDGQQGTTVQPIDLVTGRELASESHTLREGPCLVVPSRSSPPCSLWHSSSCS